MAKVPANEETMIKCICNACPTYNECMQTGKLGVFCSVGDEVRCFENEQGCNCQDCTVSSDFDFSTVYHCKDGPADRQMQSKSR
ncbi:DUF2769 domain-containing protein [Methanobacterium sp.]|uniref:DUF2769 domain-containing protein n=1 Tax=Methanobacterium sp. TaxID=2164 RepID=UPI003C744E0F